jgi:hypothetical protein
MLPEINCSTEINIYSHKGDARRSYKWACKVESDKGKFVIKRNSTVLFPDMFRMEEEGWMASLSTHTVKVPSVNGNVVCNDFHFLFWSISWREVCLKNMEKI